MNRLGSGIGKYIRILSVLLLTLSALCGCTHASDTSGIAGVWRLDEVCDGEITIPDAHVDSFDITVKLEPNGKGLIDHSIMEGSLTWKYDSGTLWIESGGKIFRGHLEGNRLVMIPDGTEISLTFIPVSSETDFQEESVRTDPVPAETWYGWWKSDSSEGNMPVSWYDCCAVFQAEDNGTVKMTLWDEDGSRLEPLSEILFRTESEKELSSLNGYFMLDEIHEGDWRLSLKENEIYLDRHLHADTEEYFSYSIYLRPWGQLWSDTDPAQRPFYYDDWYLPLIKGNQAMPDRIPWTEIEKERESIERDS